MFITTMSLFLYLLCVGTYGRFTQAFDILSHSSESSIFLPINNGGGSGEMIGELIQFPLFDPSDTSKRIGTSRGVVFNFYEDHSYVGVNGTFNFSSSNINRVLYLDEGTLTVLNQAIVLGTGKYSKYTGGTLQENAKEYDDGLKVNEISLVEPDSTEQDNEESEITLRLEADGGYYEAITDKNGNQIGALYQNIIYDADNNVRIGVNQGYSYHFPNETFIAKLGYPTEELWNGNRQFIFEDGSMDVFNRVVVHGTGQYKQYSGAVFSEETISTDPTYVGEIKLVPASKVSSHKERRRRTVGVPDYDFLINFEPVFYDPILNPDQIGERFQIQVMSPAGSRIGTYQAYDFNFPPDEAGYATSGLYNRIVYLEGGELNVMDQVIVGATGIYEAFAGGLIDVTVIEESAETYMAEITLIPPGDLPSGKNVSDTEEDKSGCELRGTAMPLIALSFTSILFRLITNVY